MKLSLKEAITSETNIDALLERLDDAVYEYVNAAENAMSWSTGRSAAQERNEARDEYRVVRAAIEALLKSQR